jgi:hypothetical protein
LKIFGQDASAVEGAVGRSSQIADQYNIPCLAGRHADPQFHVAVVGYVEPATVGAVVEGRGTSISSHLLIKLSYVIDLEPATSPLVA